MMRKVFSVALMATMACVFGLAQSANAGTTIDVVFQDAITPTGITINAGDPGPGCTFTGYYHRTVATGRCMNVMLYTTDPLIGVGVSVDYDNDNGLAVMGVREWAGVGVSFNKLGTLQKSCGPAGPVVDNGGIIQQFDCIIPPPNAPPSLAPGTYRMGTIIWDTSGTVAGGDNLEVIAAVIAGGDGVGAVINGNILDTTALVVVRSHILNLNIIPEPGTASLLGLGLVGLILAGRRSRA